MHSTSSESSPDQGVSEPRGLIHRLRTQAELQPDAEALGDSNDIVTYGALVNRVARVAAPHGDLREAPPVVVL
ncbi:MAG: hypothetical protein RL219_230, partial [Actinomycetota bacterium]